MTRLYDLVPGALRALDELRGAPLRDLLDLFNETLDHIDEDLAQAYDDLFIETCAEWAIPYIGEVVGHRPLRGGTTSLTSPRAEVARTLGYRRRKGTAAVLEQIAHDISGRPARVVEAWQALAITQHFLHLRPHIKQSPDLRRPRDHTGPFATSARTIDVRRHQQQNLPATTLFLWRLRDLPLARVTPFALDTTRERFTFDPLGLTTPLFNHPDPAYDGPVTAPEHVPAPISRRALHDNPRTYYGEGKSIAVFIDGKPVDPTLVNAADLRDDPSKKPAWNRLARPGHIAIDPVLGRLAISPTLFNPKSKIEVSYRVGAADELGGGQYERDLTPTAVVAVDPANIPKPVANDLAKLLETGGTVELTTSHTLTLAGFTLDVPAGKRITIRAAARTRPVILISDLLTLTGGDDAELILDGLVIAGPLVVPATSNLRSLTLRHCTLVPGPTPLQPTASAPNLAVASPNLRLHLEACITGPLQLPPSTIVDATRCILDAGAPDSPAFFGPDPKTPGGTLSLDRCTVHGSIRAAAVDLVTNSLLLGPLTCTRRQSGCVRHSFIAPGSSTPRRHQCLPDDGPGPFAPLFHSLHFGHPQYALLRQDSPPRLREAADDEAEPGVFHDLLLPLIEANLRTRLEDHLRLGLVADLSFVT